MANTLTGLIPTLYEALDTVSRELVGFIPAVRRDSAATAAAKDETIRIPVAPTATAANVTPAVTAPDNGDQTIGYTDMTISKSRYVPVRWNGEEQVGLRNGGQYESINRDRFAQAMRTLANEVETDLAGLYVSASRAHGTAGTTPFAYSAGVSLGPVAQIRKILADNGAPLGDLQLVMDTAAGANLRTLAQVTDVNTAGTTDPLRRGVLLDIHGMMLRESGQIQTHTKGTGSSYAVDLVAGYPAGTTTIHVDTGTGTFVAGDVITVADEPAGGKYVIATGFAGDGDGDIVIAEPGLQSAIENNKAVTIGDNFTANLGFDRNALALVTRVPAMPDGGDAADDVTVITDPVSGLSFQVALYRQYRQVKIEIGLAWGYKAVKPEHMAILLG